MARTGRFGHLPGSAPDLTGTIVALMEAYERQRDSNIIDAWQNGGEFEGRPVTDERLMQWYKTRRSQFTKDDPEYDYWDQQYEQVDYQIGESKTLLKYQQGTLNEAGVSRWYTANARRFPKNSEAWREAMRNAASFKKAAQEKAHTSNTVSKNEQFQRAVDRVNKNLTEPANKAIELFEKTLSRTGVQANGGFRAFNASQLGMADTAIDDFLNSTDGAEFAKQWQDMTGMKFGWRSLETILEKARRGSAEKQRIARKFGYQSYVPSFREEGRQFDEYMGAVKVFRANVFDKYNDAHAQWVDALDAAGGDVDALREANRIFAGKLHSLETEADSLGDYETAGQFKGEREAVWIGTVTSPSDNVAESTSPNVSAAKSSFNPKDIQLDATGNVIRQQGWSDREYQAAIATTVKNATDGLANGSWTYVMDPVSGKVQALPNERIAGLGDTGQFATDWTTITVNGKKTSVRVAIWKQPVNYIAPGVAPIDTGAKHWKNLDGTDLWEYFNASTGRVETTAVSPMDLNDDGSPDTSDTTIVSPFNGKVDVYSGMEYVPGAGGALGTWNIVLNPEAFMQAGPNGAPIPMPLSNGDGSDTASQNYIGLWNRLTRGQSGLEGNPDYSYGPHDQPVYMRPEVKDLAPQYGETAQQHSKRMRATYNALKASEDEAVRNGMYVPPSQKMPGSYGEWTVVAIPGNWVDADRNLVPSAGDYWESHDPIIPDDQKPKMVPARQAKYPTFEEYTKTEQWKNLAPEQRTKMLQYMNDGVVTDDPTSADRTPAYVQALRMLNVTVEPDLPATEAHPAIPTDTLKAPAGTGWTSWAPTLPTVLSDALSSPDRSGQVVGWATSYASRKRFASMTLDARQQVFDDIISANGWQNDPAMQTRLAYDLDAIGAYGVPGMQEYDYYKYAGATPTIEDAINRSRKMSSLAALKNQQHGGSLTDSIKGDAIDQLKASGMDDAAIRAQFPQFYDPTKPSFTQPPAPKTSYDILSGIDRTQALAAATQRGIGVDPNAHLKGPRGLPVNPNAPYDGMKVGRPNTIIMRPAPTPPAPYSTPAVYGTQPNIVARINAENGTGGPIGPTVHPINYNSMRIPDMAPMFAPPIVGARPPVNMVRPAPMLNVTPPYALRPSTYKPK